MLEGQHPVEAGMGDAGSFVEEIWPQLECYFQSLASFLTLWHSNPTTLPLSITPFSHGFHLGLLAIYPQQVQEFTKLTVAQELYSS
ncbi:hypothetical protein U9M48_025019 [Paspalum notatum var. saurae]|uniref:Uncharacterized protein n=1 Tax=Paspalum notatum var. saurae TaxID=547442 RepID=A0AAQ3TPX3_PASNO